MSKNQCKSAYFDQSQHEKDEKSAMNQLEILAIACNLLKVEENSRGQCDCHWLKKLSRDYQAIYLVYQS